MATYLELWNIAGEEEYPNLEKKVQTAIILAAKAINEEVDTTPHHYERYNWAVKAVGNPGAQARRMLPMIIAANHTASVADILGASDNAIQTNVDNTVNMFALFDASNP